MKYYEPDYIREFTCIADQCRHSCCKGWEIDINEETLKQYSVLPEPWRSRIARNIAIDEDGAHFALTEDEKCPFLNERGLCEMILGLGENALCQICRDHPRFRNFLSDRTETGLGLCCEAAGRLILGRKEKTELVLSGDDGEENVLAGDDAEVLSLREAYFSVAQDRSLPFSERLGQLAGMCGVKRVQSGKEIAEILLSLEIMEEEWQTLVERLGSAEVQSSFQPEPGYEAVFEQLLFYFLFRHIPEACDTGEAPAFAAFCVFSCDVIGALCNLQKDGTGTLSFEDVVNICRMYSAEIEYSDENTGNLLEML